MVLASNSGTIGCLRLIQSREGRGASMRAAVKRLNPPDVRLGPKMTVFCNAAEGRPAKFGRALSSGISLQKLEVMPIV